MPSPISHSPLSALFLYYSALLHFLLFCPSSLLVSFPSSSTTPRHVQLHLYNLILTVRLFDTPHYRASSYRVDLSANLSNVAIPGTGVPLSFFVRNKSFLLLFLFVVNPIVCCMSALNLLLVKRTHDVSSAGKDFSETLLCPSDWFSLWRSNCNLVAYHSSCYGNTPGYSMENKWHFLKSGAEAGFPISPFLSYPSLVVKHRNVEGGMGIHFFDNALNGGDWIFQKRINNSAFVNTLLPGNAPLSTFRIITISRACLRVKGGGGSDKNATDDSAGDATAATTAGTATKRSKSKASTPPPTPSFPTATIAPPCRRADVSSLSCVFRAGRINALTDHDSIQFDVDRETQTLKGGTTNKNWYNIGLKHVLPGGGHWRSGDEGHKVEVHPDCVEEAAAAAAAAAAEEAAAPAATPSKSRGGASRKAAAAAAAPRPRGTVAGTVIPDLESMFDLVELGHMQLMPDVPIVGWDVVLSDDADLPTCILEVNLSCNFFRGTFDKDEYYQFLGECFEHLDEITAEKEREKDNKKRK